LHFLTLFYLQSCAFTAGVSVGCVFQFLVKGAVAGKIQLGSFVVASYFSHRFG
jgi:hypothetical protein